MTKQILESAFALHQQGRLDEARRLYDAILEVEPTHFDVLHLLGLVTHEAGMLNDSERYFLAALEIKSDFGQIYTSYASHN